LKKLNRVSDSLFFLVWSGGIIYAVWSSYASGRWFLAAWFTFIVGFIVHSFVGSAIRTRATRRFARTKSLIYTGDSLPQGLAVARTSFATRNYSISNCMQGVLCEIPLAIFDLSYRSGKSSCSQTIVAFRRQGSNAIPEPPIDSVGSYQFEEAGDWIIGYVPRRCAAISELEDWSIELHILARDLLAEAKGESEARPRLFRWMT
jgi:hypothetical protein